MPDNANNLLFLNSSSLPSCPVESDSGERKPPESLLLLTYGRTEYTKGGKKGYYDFARKDGEKILAEFNDRGKDVVFDYEHQTLKGVEAPASGWITGLELTDKGLVGNVKWTGKATDYLQNGEYRYFSPVFYQSRRRPFSLHSVALTNHPATHGAPELVAAGDDEAETETKRNKGVHEMDELLKELGLVVLADDDANTKAATEKIKALMETEGKLTSFLKLHDSLDLDAVTGKIKGMVPAGELTALNDRLAGIEAEKAVSAAMENGKIVTAQKEWALDYAKSNLKAFNDFVDKAPKVAPGSADGTDVNASGSNGEKQVALTDDDKAACAALGLDESEYLKAKQEG